MESINANCSHEKHPTFGKSSISFLATDRNVMNLRNWQKHDLQLVAIMPVGCRVLAFNMTIHAVTVL